MKTVVFPTDFKDKSEGALNFAVNFCLTNHCKLVLVHSYFAMAQETGLSNEVMQTLITNAADDANHQMDLLKKRLASHENLVVESQVNFGFPIDIIVDACKETKADILITATAGARGLLDKLAGTITMSVAKRLMIPILAIPYESKLENIDEMLYATSYDEKDKKIIDQLLKLAHHFTAKVQTIHIVEEHEPQIDSASKLADQFRDLFANKPIHFRNLKRTDLESGIETYISTHKPDVLVLAHHHRSFLSSLFHFSVTKYFAYHAQLPLLILPVME